MGLFDASQEAARAVLDAADDRLSEYEREVSELQEALGDAQQEASDLARRLTASDAAVSELDVQLRAATARVETLTREADAHRLELAAAHEEIARLTALVDACPGHEPEPPRDPALWPYPADDVWNTPLGADVVRGSTSHPLSIAFRRYVDPADGVLKRTPGTVNGPAYSTSVNYCTPGGAPVTLRPVEAGTWGPRSSQGVDVVVPDGPGTVVLAGDAQPSLTTVGYAGAAGATGGAISFTNRSDGKTSAPDAFIAFVHRELDKAWVGYKGVDAPTSTTPRTPDRTSRVVLVRRGTIREIDLRGPSRWDGSRAGRSTVLDGLIRAWQLDLAATDPRNAIRTALALALHASQMLRPSRDTVDDHPAAWRETSSGPERTAGYQHPARGFDAHAESAYDGPIRMGMLFVLDPTWDFENDPLIAGNPYALAVCYALRDFGAYVLDITRWGPTLYVEQGVPTAAGSPFAAIKTAWQVPGGILDHMVPVLNNSASALGGPGRRVRALAPALIES